MHELGLLRSGPKRARILTGFCQGFATPEYLATSVEVLSAPKTTDIGEKHPPLDVVSQLWPPFSPRLGGGSARGGAGFSRLHIGTSFTRRLRFWAVAARRNSSLAPDKPRSRRRVSFNHRLRCANSISIFFRRARAVARRLEGVCLGQVADFLPGLFVHQPDHRPVRRIRALSAQRAIAALRGFGLVPFHSGLGIYRAKRQLMALWADIRILAGVIGKIITGQFAVCL